METTQDEATFLSKIKPPPLEDAGLEDCALPPDAIHEAFLKAAKAVKSIIPFPYHHDDCLNDPWPATKDAPDMVVGIEGEDSHPSGSCSIEKGGGGELGLGGDKVVVVGGEEESVDDVVVVDVIEGGGEACVDGMQGLKIGDNEKENNQNDEEEEEESGGDEPILVEGFV